LISFLRAGLDGSLINKIKSFVFDLDGIINHPEKIPHGLVIKGSLKNSFMDPGMLETLALLSGKINLFVNTARSEAYIQDFRQHFIKHNIPIHGWILEHGAVVLDKPEWTQRVLKDINLAQIHNQICKVAVDKNFPIDLNCYYNDHKGFLLYSGKGKLLAEHFIYSLQKVLKDNFRILVGKRKIAFIPKLADKYLAFNNNFGHTNQLSFAAGDSIDDLTLLKHAHFPLTLGGASQVVKEYVKKRDGYISPGTGHAGIKELIHTVHQRLLTPKSVIMVPGPRLPVEKTETFRPSRVSYLKRLFQNPRDFKKEPDLLFIQKLGKDLNFGKNIIIEAAMRDWGGEVKALRAILKAFTNILPFARWRLIFRQERLGMGNIKSFKVIIDKLEQYQYLPGGQIRFSAPGVPGSPLFPEKSDTTLLLFDHPEDLKQWYDLAMPRMITRHPEIPDTWFVNPMFLKISDSPRNVQNTRSPLFSGSKVMMAANIVDQTDIDIAVTGYLGLKPHVDTLIMAPRVITNKTRNRLIYNAVQHMNVNYYSKFKKTDKPEVLIVDTYGDLSKLYQNCLITYLGGGFDHRKRGFDPMESLFVNVPVILGPIYDFNRIAVESLQNTGFIHVLQSKQTAPIDFIMHAHKTILTPPDIKLLNNFIEKRTQDPMRIVTEILAGIVKIGSNGYIIEENHYFSAEQFNLNELIDTGN
jgi:hydroxymethylpyrimidine pyrophosphatase-like HAD family hydrolase